MDRWNARQEEKFEIFTRIEVFVTKSSEFGRWIPGVAIITQRIVIQLYIKYQNHD